jgi:hypothetical protein
LEEITLGTGLSYTGTTLNVSALPNSSLANSTITVATGTTGTDFNVTGSPVALGGTVTLNLPSASATTRGLLSAADWNTFNSKGTGSVTSVGLSMPSIFSVSNSPVTTTGTLTASLASQAANLVFASPNGSTGTPSFRSLVKADLPPTVVYTDQANTYTAGMKQTFTPSANTAGLNLAGVAADPAIPANGDLWMNTTSNLLKTRLGGVTQEIVTNSATQTLTNKTISGTNNTFTNIPVSALTSSTISLNIGTSGTDANVSGSPATLGSALTLNLPSASATNRGLLTSGDWTAFNNKISLTSLLTGLSTASATPITATDNVLAGFGKLQGQINNINASGFLTGASGTLNYVPKFTVAGTTLGNSQIFDNGTNVGIGTATPAQKLDISGNLSFSGALMPGNSAGTSGYILQSNGNNSAPSWVDPSSLLNLNAWTTGGNNFSGTAAKQFGSIQGNAIAFITNNAERMRLMDGTGYLGINTNAPGNFLEVKGALASTVSGLRLNGLGAVTPAAANGKVLSVNSSGDVIVTDPPASTGYIQNQIATNQTADMRISGRAMIGGPTTDNGMTLDVNGSVAMRVSSLALNMGSNNNIVLTNSAFFRITGPTGDFEINSIAGGTDGRMIILYNATNYNMTIKDEGTGTAGNTIYCPDTGATPPGTADIVVKKKGSATLIYSAADAHWIIVSTR